MTDVITDRQAIASAVTAGLDELDGLRDNYLSAQQQVAVAEQAAEQAADVYAAKINDVLATGWATPEALARQGHEVPKKKATRGRKRSLNGDSPEAAAQPELQ